MCLTNLFRFTLYLYIYVTIYNYIYVYIYIYRPCAYTYIYIFIFKIIQYQYHWPISSSIDLSFSGHLGTSRISVSSPRAVPAATCNGCPDPSASCLEVKHYSTNLNASKVIQFMMGYMIWLASCHISLWIFLHVQRIPVAQCFALHHAAPFDLSDLHCTNDVKWMIFKSNGIFLVSDEHDEHVQPRNWQIRIVIKWSLTLGSNPTFWRLRTPQGFCQLTIT